MRRLYCLSVFFLAVVIGAVGYGQEKKGEKQGTEEKSSIPLLASLEAADRMRFLGQASRDRSDLLGALLSQLDPAKPKEVTFSIAFLLGYYRMEESPRHLSPFIALEAEHTTNDRLSLWGRYPIVDALVRIGGPAIPEMIKNIETSGDAKVRELSTIVIRAVDGPEIARFRLQKAMQKEPDPAKKAWLKEAMESIKD